jgi:hypothetical protein
MQRVAVKELLVLADWLFKAHHPGPGSWLDKATAALAMGNALPGSHAYDTT